MRLNEIKSNPTKDWLDKMDIENYTINADGTVDVDGNVNITSLQGGPKQVGRGFYCNDNNLTSLQGAPERVGGEFSCNYNNLTSLQGGPERVGGHFFCSNNKLISLHQISKQIKYIGGEFDIEDNPLKSNILGLVRIKGLQRVVLDNKQAQKIINRNLGDIHACQEQMLEAGLEDMARL